MSADVRLQVQALRSSLGVEPRKRTRRLRPLDYSALHAMQNRYEQLGGSEERVRPKLPPIPARRRPLVLPELKDADPEMEARMGYCRRELARSEGWLRSAQAEHDARDPFLPRPGVQVPVTHSMPKATTFLSESRAQYRGLLSVPGLPRGCSVPPPPGAPGSRQRAVAPYF